MSLKPGTLAMVNMEFWTIPLWATYDSQATDLIKLLDVGTLLLIVSGIRTHGFVDYVMVIDPTSGKIGWVNTAQLDVEYWYDATLQASARSA